MTRQVKGLILKKHDYRESDRLFVIYTDELGKIEAVAKGSRKIQSKMSGHLDLFSVVDLMVAPGKTYYQIAGANRRKNFLNIKNDLVRTVLASFCLEAVDGFTKLDHPDQKVYELLEGVLEIFDDLKIKSFFKLYILSKFFVLKLLALLGWTPELRNCVNCKKQIIPNGNFFDAVRGGLVCGQCIKTDLPISTTAIKILRFVLKNDLKKATALRINNNIEETPKIIDAFTAVHRDKEFKSVVWINYLTQTLKV